MLRLKAGVGAVSQPPDKTPAHTAAEDAPLPPDPVIEYYKAQVDRDLLRANLKLTVEQRFENLEIMQIFAEILEARMETILGLPHRLSTSSSL